MTENVGKWLETVRTSLNIDEVADALRNIRNLSKKTKYHKCLISLDNFKILIARGNSSIQTNTPLLSSCLSILANLAIDETNCSLLLSADVVKFLEEIFRELDDNAIVARGARLLANIAQNDISAADYVMESETVFYLLKISSQCSDPECIAAINRALRIIALSSDDNCRNFLRFGGVRNLMEHVRVNSSSLIVHTSITTIAAFVKWSASETAQQIVDSGHLLDVVELSRSENGFISNRAFYILIELCQQSCSRPLLGNVGIIKRLVDYICENYTNSHNTFAVINALCMFTHEGINRMRLRDYFPLFCRILQDPSFSLVHRPIISSLLCYMYDEESLVYLVQRFQIQDILGNVLNRLVNERHQKQSVSVDEGIQKELRKYLSFETVSKGSLRASTPSLVDDNSNSSSEKDSISVDVSITNEIEMLSKSNEPSQIKEEISTENLIVNKVEDITDPHETDQRNSLQTSNIDQGPEKFDEVSNIDLKNDMLLKRKRTDHSPAVDVSAKKKHKESEICDKDVKTLTCYPRANRQNSSPSMQFSWDYGRSPPINLTPFAYSPLSPASSTSSPTHDFLSNAASPTGCRQWLPFSQSPNLLSPVSSQHYEIPDTDYMFSDEEQDEPEEQSIIKESPKKSKHVTDDRILKSPTVHQVIFLFERLSHIDSLCQAICSRIVVYSLLNSWCILKARITNLFRRLIDMPPCFLRLLLSRFPLILYKRHIFMNSQALDAQDLLQRISFTAQSVYARGELSHVLQMSNYPDRLSCALSVCFVLNLDTVKREFFVEHSTIKYIFESIKRSTDIDTSLDGVLALRRMAEVCSFESEKDFQRPTDHSSCVITSWQTDMSLVFDDQQSIQIEKLQLSSLSPVFKTMISNPRFLESSQTNISIKELKHSHFLNALHLTACGLDCHVLSDKSNSVDDVETQFNAFLKTIEILNMYDFSLNEKTLNEYCYMNLFSCNLSFLETMYTCCSESILSVCINQLMFRIFVKPHSEELVRNQASQLHLIRNTTLFKDISTRFSNYIFSLF